MSGKHWIPAKKQQKKHLEYLPEGTSLRIRNRPDESVPRRLGCLEHRLPERPRRGWRRRLGDSESRIGRQDRQIQTEKFHWLCAHLMRNVARVMRGSQHRGKAGAGAAGLDC